MAPHLLHALPPEILGQSHVAERERAREEHGASEADGELGGAASDVDAQSEAPPEGREGMERASVGEIGLFLTRDHADLDPRGLRGGGEEIGAVWGLADGGGGDAAGVGWGDAVEAEELPEAAEGVDGGGEGGGAAAEDDGVAAAEDGDECGGGGLGYEELEGVRSHVDRRREQ